MSQESAEIIEKLVKLLISVAWASVLGQLTDTCIQKLLIALHIDAIWGIAVLLLVKRCRVLSAAFYAPPHFRSEAG
jgi:hypothetical protein